MTMYKHELCKGKRPLQAYFPSQVKNVIFDIATTLASAEITSPLNDSGSTIAEQAWHAGNIVNHRNTMAEFNKRTIQS